MNLISWLRSLLHPTNGDAPANEITPAQVELRMQAALHRIESSIHYLEAVAWRHRKERA